MAGGLVASQHAAGTQVGVDILRRGGNAMDAAVAAAMALNVAEPWNGGLGGGGFLISYNAESGATTVYDFNICSPAAAHPGMFELEEGVGPEEFGWRAVAARENAIGAKAVGVPGSPAGLACALQREGTLDLVEVVEPAATLAETGVVVDWFALLVIGAQASRLAASAPSAAAFLPGGFPRAVGETIRQPELARTLRTLARDGAETFYRGTVAEMIVAAVREQGGLLDLSDLEAYEPLVLEPGSTASLGDAEAITAPEPSGGPTVVAMLESLDLDVLRSAGPVSVGVLDAVARGGLAAFDRRLARTPSEAACPPGATTHISVVDSRRNLVSLTHTLGSGFGSGLTIPGAGVTMNNCMLWFDPEPESANHVRGGVRPLANMAPVIVARDGLPVAALGASGGRRIISSVAQIAINLALFDMDAFEALAAPRIDVSRGDVLVDSRIPSRVSERLVELGHSVRVADAVPYPAEFGRPNAVVVANHGGVVSGACDPFSPGLCGGC